MKDIIKLPYNKELGAFGNALLWFKITGGMKNRVEEIGYFNKNGKYIKYKKPKILYV